MTELELKNYIDENIIECRETDYSNAVIFIPICGISRFCNLLADYFKNNVPCIGVTLNEKYITVHLDSICEYYGINQANLLSN